MRHDHHRLHQKYPRFHAHEAHILREPHGFLKRSCFQAAPFSTCHKPSRTCPNMVWGLLPPLARPRKICISVLRVLRERQLSNCDKTFFLVMLLERSLRPKNLLPSPHSCNLLDHRMKIDAASGKNLSPITLLPSPQSCNVLDNPHQKTCCLAPRISICWTIGQKIHAAAGRKFVALLHPCKVAANPPSETTLK